MAQILIVDDDAQLRQSFGKILEGEGFEVRAAPSGEAGVQEVKTAPPDLVIMDVRMPGGNGIDATRAIASSSGEDTGRPPPAVLVVTTFDLDEHVFGALEAGASGFVLKDTDPEELIAAVRTLASGQGAIDSATTRRVIAEFARVLGETAPDKAMVGRLGGEEFAVFIVGANLADGRAYAETVRAAFAAISMAGIDHAVSASFGAAQLMPGDTLFELARRADTA